MIYQFELKAELREDATQETIASMLEACAEQVRGMSSIRAAHSMQIPMKVIKVESGQHGITGTKED